MPPPPIVLVPMPQSPATLELLLPPGATATVDGKAAGSQRVFKFVEFDRNTEVRRVEVQVQQTDSTESKRSVDLVPGLSVRVPVNLLPVDQPSTILTDSAVAVLGASFSPNGRQIATVSENGAIVFWDLAAGRPIKAISGNGEGMLSVTFSPDGQSLLTSSADTTAALWNVKTGRLVRKFRGHATAVNSAVFSADGKKVLTGSTDKTAMLWDADTGGQIRVFKGHTDEVVGVALSPDGKTIATASTDRNAKLWNADTGEVLFSLRTFDTVSGIEFSPDGKLVGASNFSNAVNFWDTATGKAVGQTRRVNLDLNAFAFTPDARRFFSGGKDATAKLWDTATRLMVREFSGHATDVQSVKPSPDGRLLLTSSRDGTARVWDLATGMELVALTSSNAGKNWAAVAPDGLYDGSEGGRRMIGYRFASKLPGASVDQFFGHYYRPGLLAEIFRHERPMAAVQLGRQPPPVLKIVAPKIRSTADGQAVIVVEAVDKGGGISAPQIFNQGARLAVEPETRRDGDTVRYSFKLNLAPGSNSIRVTAASGDGSWEAIPVEVELTSTHRPDRKGRLFVLAVGLDDSLKAPLNAPPAIGDARAVADHVQRRSAGLYDRVDVVSVLGSDATRARITDTLLDLAALSQPQDTVMLLVCGRGTLLGDRFYLAPHDLRLGSAGWEADVRAQALDADDLAATLGTAPALNRVMILDVADASPAGSSGNSPGFGVRAAVERWSRALGVHAFAACARVPSPRPAGETARGLLTSLLLDPAANGGGAASVVEWFNAAAERAGPALERLGVDSRVLQQSTKPKGFPLLAAAK